MSTTFGPLLKDWRARRRMSQLELGLTANVSARHVSFLETGRARPSHDMVLQLSQALEAPLRVRNDLLQAAGFRASYTRRALTDAEMAPIGQAIDWTLGRHDPYPGYALDRHWRIVKMNRAATAMMAPFEVKEGESLLEAILFNTGLRSAILNLNEVARHLITRLRAEAAHDGGDIVLERAADALAESGPIAPVAEDGAAPALIPVRYRVGGCDLALFSTISVFGATDDIGLADMKIELLYPADEKTRSALFGAFGDAEAGPG
ncbi:MAG: helix-turn-helix transcriptional regulator [Alphaproteobacteria bacterium]|nr:helix-turn-helix transcriptional regulator [Alphaproteobacteria bacterium]